MKIVVFIVCILAIVRVNEATSGKEFRSWLANCMKNSKDANPTLDCSEKYVLSTGAMDEKSPIDKNKFYSLCGTLISDAAKQQKCKDINNSCYDKVKAGGTTSMDQKKKYISCGVVDNKVIDLVDS